MRQAEPAAVARRLFRGVAGHAPGLPRRILAITVVSAAVVLSVPLLIASFLALLSEMGVLLNGVFPAESRRGAVTISWLLVTVVTVAFLGLAMTVSWTSRRRDEARAGEAEGRAEPAEGAGADEAGVGEAKAGEDDAVVHADREGPAPGR